ncbi:MAG: sigma-54 factor interaction domain-containing protein [Methanobacteriota archaeon]|nr:MAG: sigma-54 factor interaction domain-containing protein [Euryarchaeota archaeon]
MPFMLEVVQKPDGQFWIYGKATRGNEQLKIEFRSEEDDFLGHGRARIPAVFKQLIVCLLEAGHEAKQLFAMGIPLQWCGRTLPTDEADAQFDKKWLVTFTDQAWDSYLRYYTGETSEPSVRWVEAFPESGLIGSIDDPQFEKLCRLIKQAAQSPLPVLIMGEAGTGKELVAKAIHQESLRSNKPFMAIDCGAIPDTLIESELFGHLKGAFTGASQTKKGLFDEADGGTLFLDEIGNASALFQSKLLRVLQEGEIRPVGESKPRKVDVRIVSATNVDLKDRVREGMFRRDLYDRLVGYTIELRPLRERRQDIPALIDYFISRLWESPNPPPIFSEELYKALIWDDWEGNIRQLEKNVQVLLECASNLSFG